MNFLSDSIKEKILKISAWVCFISLLFQIINGLWPQISMALFNIFNYE